MKLKIEQAHAPAVPLPGAHPDKTLLQKDARAPVLTAALFTTAKTRKQNVHQQEWMRKT